MGRPRAVPPSGWEQQGTGGGTPASSPQPQSGAATSGAQLVEQAVVTWSPARATAYETDRGRGRAGSPSLTLSFQTGESTIDR